MDGKKKIWATAVLCAVASVGFVVPAGAEETMTHDLDEVIVEADRNTLPGGFVANQQRQSWHFGQYQSNRCSFYTKKIY